jgi:hypothetical protein
MTLIQVRKRGTENGRNMKEVRVLKMNKILQELRVNLMRRKRS